MHRVPDRHFDAAYAETIQLADGARVNLRLIGPEDKASLRRGFERLSAESRYRRFFGVKRELTDAELRYFTEVDGEDHLAIVATRGHGDAEEGLGVARFVRIDGEPTFAEPALAVVDDWQGRGLGKVLLSRLVAAARERGITHFRVAALGDNPAVRALLAEGGDVTPEPRGEGTIGADVALPEIVAPREVVPVATPIYRLLAAAARGVAAVLGPHRS